MDILVLTIGLGLVFLANSSNGNLKSLAGVLTHTGQDPNLPSLPEPKSDLQSKGMVVVGSIVFVLVLAVLSQQSTLFGEVAIALMVVLFMIWGMNNQPQMQGLVNKLLGK